MAEALLEAWGLSQLPAPTYEPREVLADYIYIADPTCCQLASHTVTLSSGHPTCLAAAMPCVSIANRATASGLLAGGGGNPNGSSGVGTQLLLQPRSVFPDPLRGAPHVLVVCDAMPLPAVDQVSTAFAGGPTAAGPAAPAAFAPECLFLDPHTGLPRALPAACSPVSVDSRMAPAAAAALFGGGERAALLAAAGLRRQQAAQTQPQPQPQWRPVEWGALAGVQPCAGGSNNISGSSSSTAGGGSRSFSLQAANGIAQDPYVTSALAAITSALGLPVPYAPPSAGEGAVGAALSPRPSSEPSESMSDGSDGSFGSGGGASSHEMLVSAILRLDRSSGKRQRTATSGDTDADADRATGSEQSSSEMKGCGKGSARKWQRRRLQDVAAREEEDTASSPLSPPAPGARW